LNLITLKLVSVKFARVTSGPIGNDLVPCKEKRVFILTIVGFMVGRFY